MSGGPFVRIGLSLLGEEHAKLVVEGKVSLADLTSFVEFHLANSDLGDEILWGIA